MSVLFSTRVMVIIHLSLLFTYLVWACLAPMTADYSRHQMISQLTEVVSSEQVPEEWWNQVSKRERIAVERGIEAQQEQRKPAWKERISSVGRLLLFGLPPFAQAWALFSFVTCLLILYRIRGFHQVVWILPLLAACYGWFNWQEGSDPAQLPDQALFPTEEYLVQYYMDDTEREAGISEQFEQLKAAWERYLVAEWSNSDPKTLENGDWHFNLRRLLAYLQSKEPDHFQAAKEREALPYLIFYLLWNLVFAAMVQKEP